MSHSKHENPSRQGQRQQVNAAVTSPRLPATVAHAKHAMSTTPNCNGGAGAVWCRPLCKRSLLNNHQRLPFNGTINALQQPISHSISMRCERYHCAHLMGEKTKARGQKAEEAPTVLQMDWSDGVHWPAQAAAAPSHTWVPGVITHIFFQSLSHY